ncbi:MAG: TolC family protein, partial [bacterium]|nr:TolC family protein [bacterium]
MKQRLFFFAFFLLFLSVPAFSLTEAEFIEQFMAKNPRWASIRLNPEITKQAEGEYKGQFDTVLSLEGNYLVDKGAQSSTVFGTDNRQLTFDLGVAKKFPIGLTSSLHWVTTRNTTNSPFATLSPYYEPSWELGLRQSLLKNSLGFLDRQGARGLSLETEQALLRARHQAERELVAGIQSYWNLKSQQSLTQINEQFLKTAEDFLKAVRTRRSRGTAEKTDLYAAQALVFERKNSLIQANSNLKGAQEEVSRLIGLGFEETVTADEKPEFEYTRTLEIEVREALEKRPDYLALKKELENQNIQITMAKNQRLPVVDLLATLTANGLKGDYGSALSDSATVDHPSLFTGVEMSLPLENRQARAGLTRENIRKQQLVLELQDLETNLVKEVREASRDLLVRLEMLKNLEEISRLQS